MKWFKRIHLIDRFLIVFMAIFMLQSAYNLFVNESQTQEANSMDVIIRTSAAAIFGYFISANFVRHDSLSPTQTDKTKTDKTKTELQSEESDIIETTNLKYSEPALAPYPEENQEDTAKNLQIIITAVIGLLSLCILLIFRNFFSLTPMAVGTISQLRDFVSGCVGFLIGGTTSRK